MSSDEKTLYIVRGLSGSGKSTLAKELAGSSGIVLSTDDFFMNNGKYEYDGSKISRAHKWNQERTVEYLQKGVHPIVIDNTMSQKWEAKFYVLQGISYGYNIEIREPNTPWRKNPQELAKRNTHGVPLETIERMLSRWDYDFTVDSILNS